MMIEVTNLTKRYAGNTAVADLSFTVARGEIVGLLGPNGAGKSTTMRILSCFIPATSGHARIAGLDVVTKADEVRRRIGYMPENNPLHPDMRVREYLKFRARLKGLGRTRTRQRVDVVLAQCGLADVSKRIIGQLSKGYRQRVGLADALVHEPELIILDEPTIGLDPSQIRSVRHLIKQLGQRHTVLISSHILPEVEMTCNRVLIMREGRILAADSPENLQKTMGKNGQIITEIAAPLEELKTCWAQMPEIAHYNIAAVEGEYHRCALTAVGGQDLRPPHFFAGPGTRLEVARTLPPAPFARGHLYPSDPAGKRGGKILMQVYWTLTRRELGTFFFSWIGYIVIAGAVFLMGLDFYTLLHKLQGEAIAMPIMEIFFNFSFWLILLFSAPLITMRLFALEKYSGTFETLMTAPVGDVAVVLAKFTAALVFFMIMWLPLLGCVFLLHTFTRGSNLVDAGTLCSAFLGIFLLGGLYMAIGCFASSLTRNQIVAAIISLAIGVTFFLLSFLTDQLALQKTWATQVLDHLSVWRQMQDFARGVVDTRYVVFYLTSTFFFLFLTCRVVESRRWK